MLVLPGGFASANEYFKAAISFLERYQWLYNWPVTEVLSSGVLDEMPAEWWTAFRYLTNEELNKLPRGYVKQSWPQSLKEFVRECAALRLPVADDELPTLDKASFLLDPPTRSINTKENILRHFLRKGLTPKKCHEVTYLAALVHEKCQQAGVQCVVDMGCGHGYLCEVLHHCYDYQVIGLEAVPSRVMEAQNRHRNICMNLGIEDTSGVTYMTCNVSADTPGPIIEALNSVGHTKPFCLVGLHSCGDLTPTAMKLFLQIDILRAMVLVSCCYHIMNQTDEQKGVDNKLLYTSRRITPCTKYDMSVLLCSNLKICSSLDEQMTNTECQKSAVADADDKKRKALVSPVEDRNFTAGSNTPSEIHGEEIMNTVSSSPEDNVNRSRKRLRVTSPYIPNSLSKPRARSCCNSCSPTHKHLLDKEKKIKLALMWASEQNQTRDHLSTITAYKTATPINNTFQEHLPFPIKEQKSSVHKLRKYGSEPSLTVSKSDTLWLPCEERLSNQDGNFKRVEPSQEDVILQQWLRNLLSHKTVYDAEHFSSFPLSQGLRALMTKGCMASRNRRLCTGPCTFLRRPFLRLAAQESLERWELMSPKVHRQHCVHVLARAVFDLYAKGCEMTVQKSNRRCVRRSKLAGSPNEILSELVDRMVPPNCTPLEIMKHKVSVIKLFKVLEPLGPLMEAVTGLQTALHMTCEGLILVDRLVALEMPNASIVKTADQLQTPRCYAMVAMK